MKILVCMKQVPAGTKVDIDPETGAMKRMSGATRTNPYDLFALETALRATEKVKYNRIYCYRQCYKSIKHKVWQAYGIRHSTAHYQKQRTANQCMVAFMVNAYLFYAFELIHSIVTLQHLVPLTICKYTNFNVNGK